MTYIIYPNNKVLLRVYIHAAHRYTLHSQSASQHHLPFPSVPCVSMYVWNMSKLKSHVGNIPEASLTCCVHGVLAPFGTALTWSVRVLARIDLIVGPPAPSTPRHKKSTDGPRLGPETAPRSAPSLPPSCLPLSAFSRNLTAATRRTLFWLTLKPLLNLSSGLGLQP